MSTLCVYFQGKRQLISGVGERETVDGLSSVDSCITFLKRSGSREPIVLSQKLSLAARDIVQDLGPKGATGNILNDGTKASERFARYGTWKTKV